MSGEYGSTSIELGGGCSLAVYGSQLNAGGQFGSRGGRLLPRLPYGGGDVSIFRSPAPGDSLSAGPFGAPTGLTSHGGSPIGPGGPKGAGNVRSPLGLYGAVGFPSPPGLMNWCPLDPRGVRSSAELIGAASNGVAGNFIPGHFAIGSLQSLLHHVSSSAATMGRVPTTCISDGSDQLLSAQTSLDGSHVQTCGYSSLNDGKASSPIDLEVDDAPVQDSSDSDPEDPLQDEHNDADAEDSDDSSEDALPINNQLTLQASANGSSEDVVPINNQSSHTGPADEDALLQYEIISIPLGDGGRVSNNLGYKKRVRVPKGVTIPDFRPPREMGTIEKAMRNAKNRKGKPIFEPVLGMVFDSRAEAYKFYNLYSWERGFGIRFGTSASNPVNKKRTKQLIVCEKEGFDARCKSRSKRSHCKAMLQLHRTEDLGWYVSQHVAEHNHPLSVLNGEKREWRSHGEIEQCTKDMIRYLRENNVSLSRVHCIMGSMFGSMEDIPFNQKSLRAVCTQIAKDQKDDDVAKTLEVFKKMRADDPGFQFSVQLDEEKKIQTLIWTSGRSRSQYHFFGDVVTFDTTYCTNIYKMPFGMFVGVNNHFQSVLYAGVLMRNETAESFKWVFQEFLNLMGGKAPVTILTDQCKAMTKAIREVFAQTNHFWCKWHVFKDAPEELGPVYRRNGPFRREFHYVINEMLTEDEFERAWDDLLQRYNLRNHPFMERAYAKRQKWAKPWAKDKFCARMASTQRSESANSILKKVVPRNSSMNRFVEQYQKLLFIRASSEQKAEHQTKQFELRAKRVYAIEKHAFKVYTKNCFQLFSAEVDKASQYGVVRHDSGNTFKVIHNNAEIRKDWARSVFIVVVENDGKKYSCECGLYEHFGMLCCHAIKVLIHCAVTKIPEAHIMKRWTRSARDFEYNDDISRSGVDPLGQGFLYVNALDVVHTVGKDAKSGEILMKYLTMARKEIKALQEEQMKEKGYVESSGYISGCTSQAEDGDLSGYDSDGQPTTRNMYGASGSSAYMSDKDIQNIQAPTVPPKTSGRPIENRVPRMFEKWKKGHKRSASSHNDEGFCDRCNEEGHMRHACKLKPKVPRNKKAATALKPKVLSKKKASTTAQSKELKM